MAYYGLVEPLLFPALFLGTLLFSSLLFSYLTRNERFKRAKATGGRNERRESALALRRCNEWTE